MLIDSHCHLDRLDLKPYDNSIANYIQQAGADGVKEMLSVSVDLEAWPALYELVEPYSNIALSVGVHPNVQSGEEPTVERLVALANNDKVVAIGETGLDYFRSKGDLEWQHRRFRVHIEAARQSGKPLIIHTRDAKEDTMRILEEERAGEIGGVLHCFTEDWPMAERLLELGFYISFSGIVTFKNASTVHDVAARVPDDRLLIETDAPYLAPAPYRGKPNYPHYVHRVAERLADLRNSSVEQIARLSEQNFRRLFSFSPA